MTPVELKAKIDELRAAIAEIAAASRDDPAWGTEKERDELADALDGLLVDLENLETLLQE